MIIALMYCQSDLAETMQLARLLADVEPSPRDDDLLALVRQPDVPMTPLIELTTRHCSKKFEVEDVVSPLGASGHPVGCTALWTGTCQHFYERHLAGDLGPHLSIATLDGGDGVPLCADWIDRFKEEHDESVRRGHLITASPYFVDRCPLHVNPNGIFELDVFGKTHLLTPPTYDGTLNTHFDIYHREEMLAHAGLSSIVRTDWHGQGEQATRELLLDRSKESVWLHGYKDADLRWLCREHLASEPAPPEVRHYELADVRLHEVLRRSYEEVNW